MTAYVVFSGTSQTGRITMGGSDTLLVQQNADLTVGINPQAVRFTGPTNGAVITVNGTIEANSAIFAEPRAIRFENSIGNSLDALIDINTNGVVRAVNDAIQIQNGSISAGELEIDNAGTIESEEGQALDLTGVSGSFFSTITNSGSITADTSDAIRIGEGGVIANTGTIDGGSAIIYSGGDGVQFEDFSIGNVTNSGTISGDRHGINAQDGTTVDVVNQSGGLISGRNGSGLGSDGTATVVNYGTIRGNTSGQPATDLYGSTPGAPNGGGPDGTPDGDGDGVDIDRHATIVNYGMIRGVAASGTGSDGEANTAEGIAAGGGSITNYFAATIFGADRGITIDNSSGGNSLYQTEITNAGTIEGGADTGIKIVGQFADEISNSGSIIGGNGFAIQFGDGDNRLVIEDGSAMTGIADGEGGTNTIDYSNYGSGVTAVLLIGTATGTDGIDNFSVVIGSDHNDEFYGTFADETLNGGDGDDTISGGDGADLILGGDGADDIIVFDGQDSIFGEDGNDTIVADGPGDKLIEGGSGNDSMLSNATNATMYGGSGDDTILAGAGDNEMMGQSGNDLIIGNASDERINGGSGDDTIDSGAGNDTIVGSAGMDRMVGGEGDDQYFIQELGDTATELDGFGYDTVIVYYDGYTSGLNEIEEIRLVGPTAREAFGNAIDNLIAGNGGSDTLHGGDGNDTLSGNGAGDELNGDAGDDRLLGSDGFDTLMGGADSDRLEGQGDTDLLDGGEGSDTLFGGDGRDTMTGGAGADRFVFGDGETADTVTQADRITDFSQTDGDEIDLRSIDGIAGTTDSAFSFVGTAAFSNIAGELRYEQAGGETRIFGDTDGDGVADLVIRLESELALVATDFLL